MVCTFYVNTFRIGQISREKYARGIVDTEKEMRRMNDETLLKYAKYAVCLVCVNL